MSDHDVLPGDTVRLPFTAMGRDVWTVLAVDAESAMATVAIETSVRIVTRRIPLSTVREAKQRQRRREFADELKDEVRDAVVEEVVERTAEEVLGGADDGTTRSEPAAGPAADGPDRPIEWEAERPAEAAPPPPSAATRPDAAEPSEPSEPVRGSGGAASSTTGRRSGGTGHEARSASSNKSSGGSATGASTDAGPSGQGAKAAAATAPPVGTVSSVASSVLGAIGWIVAACVAIFLVIPAIGDALDAGSDSDTASTDTVSATDDEQVAAPPEAAVGDCVQLSDEGSVLLVDSCPSGATPYEVTGIVEATSDCAGRSVALSGDYGLCLELNLVDSYCYTNLESGSVVVPGECEVPGSVNVLEVLPAGSDPGVCWDYAEWEGDNLVTGTDDDVLCVIEY